MFYQIWNSGGACIAVASMIYAIAAALVRPLDENIPILEIVCVRSGLSLVFSYIAYVIQSPPKPFSNNSNIDNDTNFHNEIPKRFFGCRTNFPFLAMRGLVGAAAMDMFYASLRLLSLGDAVSLLFTNPAITAAIAAIFLKETLRWPGIAGCVSSLVGMILVVRPPVIFGNDSDQKSLNVDDDENLSRNRLYGCLFGISSAVLAAGAYYAIRLIGQKESSLTIAVWFHVSAFTHSTFLLLLGLPDGPIIPGFRDWLCLIGIAIASFSANILLNRGFQVENAALASAVNYTQVIYAHIIGAAIFGEQLEFLGIFASAIILIGVISVAWDSKRGKAHDGEKYEHGSNYSKRDYSEESELLPLTGTANQQPSRN